MFHFNIFDMILKSRVKFFFQAIILNTLLLLLPLRTTDYPIHAFNFFRVSISTCPSRKKLVVFSSPSSETAEQQQERTK